MSLTLVRLKFYVLHGSLASEFVEQKLSQMRYNQPSLKLFSFKGNPRSSVIYYLLLGLPTPDWKILENWGLSLGGLSLGKGVSPTGMQ